MSSVDAALVNREEGEVREFEPEFSALLQVRGGERTTVVAERYRPAFTPLIPVLGTKGFMIMSAGADVVPVAGGPERAVTPAANVR